MLKLIKYEFRKNRTGLMIMLLVAAGLFLIAPLGRALEREELMALSVILLFIYAFAAYVFALARGIAAYSGELRSRSGYLLLMVPRSTMSILFSKLLFTFVFALLMLAVSLLALGGAGSMLLSEMYQLRTLMETVRFALAQVSLRPEMIAGVALFFVVEILSSLLTLTAIGYLSVTLSATVLQNRKLRGLLDGLFFAALYALVLALTNQVSPEIDVAYMNYATALQSNAPSLLLNLGFTVLFTALSAVLLKRKVTL